jgi:hypothetical protein
MHPCRSRRMQPESSVDVISLKPRFMVDLATSSEKMGLDKAKVFGIYASHIAP